jgi:hypothetical protein
VEKRDLEVDWERYFQSISHVCPWSLESFQQGRIDFVPFSWDGLQAREATWPKLTRDNFDAVVYITIPETSQQELDFICESMEGSPNCIYFWSHPDHTKGGNNQAPLPIIIQQDRENLTRARHSLKKHK